MSHNFYVQRIKQLTVEDETIDSTWSEADVEHYDSDEDHSDRYQLREDVEEPTYLAQGLVYWMTDKVWWVEVSGVAFSTLSAYSTSPGLSTHGLV